MKNNYPKSVPYIIGNEAAERFSFYGMKSILVTFLAAQFFSHLPHTEAELNASQQVHFFVALAYTMPMIGAFLADSFFGKYKVILYVSIIYCFGHLALAMYDDHLTGFTIGLVLIAMGAGGIKSCVSANVGDQFNESNQHLLSKVYGWFYFSINAGAFFSIYLIPKIYNKVADGGWGFGASWAFGVPGILMALASFIFWFGRKKYVRKAPTGLNRNNFLFISFYALKNIKHKKKGESWLDIAKQSFDEERVEGIKAVYRVILVFLFIPIFWAMWDMNQIEWIQQAKKLDLHLMGSITLLPEQVTNFNSIFILLFLPILTYIIYPMMGKMGFEMTLLRRFAIGLLITALSFVVIAFTQMEIDAGEKPSVWWQVLAYAILTLGEAMVSPTGLEYAYTRSPQSMKSTMSAIWLLTVALGNVFAGFINGLMLKKGSWFEGLIGAKYYWFYAFLMLVNVILFTMVSLRLKEKVYIGEKSS